MDFPDIWKSNSFLINEISGSEDHMQNQDLSAKIWKQVTQFLHVLFKAKFADPKNYEHQC